MDQSQWIVRNVYCRYQCIERRANYRYLITAEDDDLVTDLGNFGFDKSWIPVDKCWNAFILQQNGSPHFPQRIKELLESHGYYETHNTCTERYANINGKHQKYYANKRLNLLRVYSYPKIVYERNIVYTKIIKR